MAKTRPSPSLNPRPGETAQGPLCLLCRVDSVELIHDRIRVGRETIPGRVLRCRLCGLAFLDRRGPQRPQEQYYASGEYRKEFSPDRSRPAVPVEEHFKRVHLPAQERRYQRLSHLFTEDSRVLEIGCGSGGFLYSLKGKVASCAGVELDPDHAAHARSLGLEVHARPLGDVKFGEGFDFICMFHVLEHLPEPLEFVRSLRPLLKPKGRLIVEVPSTDDPLVSIFDAREFKSFYYQAPHLYYFSRKTLSELLRQAGFGAVDFLSFQQYGLLNNLSWVLNGRPFNNTREEGRRSIPPDGHLDRPDRAALGELMDFLDEAYRGYLERKGRLDTLLCTAAWSGEAAA